MATTQTVTTSALPTGFETYYKTGVPADAASGKSAIPGLIPQAFGLYGKGTPEDFQKHYVDPLKAAGLYGADRVADINEYQKLAGEGFLGLERPEQFNMATGAIGSGYGAAAGLPSMIDPGVLEQYMSPYVQNVVDIQKQKAIEDAMRSQLDANLSAARASQGTYGGSRQLLAQTQREKALGQGLAEIQAKGLQSAYEAAQKGLEAERTSRLDQAKTFGDLGQQFGQVGVSQQQSDIERLKATAGYGDFLRAAEQQELDTRFFDLMKGLNYSEDQLEKLNAFIRGIPLPDTTEVKTTPLAPLGPQLVGAGLGILGAAGGQQPQRKD